MWTIDSKNKKLELFVTIAYFVTVAAMIIGSIYSEINLKYLLVVYCLISFITWWSRKNFLIAYLIVSASFIVYVLYKLCIAGQHL